MLLKEKNAPGAQIKGMIPLSIPVIGGNEWKYVKDCLDTGWVSSVGSYVDSFERIFAKYLGRKYAVACVSGTAALHISLLLKGLKSDEEIVMPSLTFAAPAFAARYVGAWPVFMDVDPIYWQMDINKLQDFIKKECRWVRGKLINRHTKRTVRGILPVHILGHPVDMTPLLKLAHDYDLWVIEDGAESLGSQYKGRKSGSFGDLACFSFNGNKVITSGGGGMIVTNDERLAKRARHLTTQAKLDPIEYVHDEIGYNYRLTNLQAAVGLAQFENLERCIKAKEQIARRYDQGFSGFEGLTLPQQASGAKSIWWLYTVLVDQKKFGMDSRGLMKRLAQQQIQSRPLWCPLDQLKIFKSCYAHHMNVANDIYKRALSLPSSVNLAQADQKRVIQMIKEVGA